MKQSFLHSLLFSIVTVFSFNSSVLAASWAAPLLPWANLEKGERVQLQKTLFISPSFSLEKDLEWEVNDTLTLDPVPAMIFTLRATHCDGLSQIPVPLTLLNDLFGFEWNGACLSQWYVEFKDLYQSSYFTSQSK